MPICPNCGVELAESTKHCPLCRSAIEADGGRSEEREAPYPEKAIDPEHFDTLTDAQRRKIFLEIFSVCSAIACITVLAVEALVDGRISWSLYPVASIAYLFFVIAVPVALGRRRWRATVALAIATPLFVLSLDMLDASRSWFPRIGGPITLSVEATIAACAASISRMKSKGVNAIAVALIGAAAACVCIELAIDLAASGSPDLDWSAVVAAACLPIAALLFYAHHRLSGRASLAKLFHL
ncbi:MAG: hypothetical protein CVV47_15300 [Spirochaetae bacterium HGW-Spirochaetae-3]|jgi:hypothetical protein|nr:MAG: hypothetical protein CVV47_15300 [Spirochaetae bacterium HGW-Spirochaetae-3]